MRYIEALLLNPLMSLAVAVILVVIGSTLNAAGTNWLLVAAWVLIVVSVFRTPPVSRQVFIQRALWAMLAAALAGLALCWLAGWQPAAPEVEARAANVIGSVPNGMTLTPLQGPIQLTFKSSPLFTSKTKQRITRNLTLFRDYLVQLEIPVPIEFPPIGTREPEDKDDVTAIQGVNPTGAAYTGEIILTDSIASDPFQITSAYSSYTIQQLLLAKPVGNSTNLEGKSAVKPTDVFQFIFAINGFADYLNMSFWNRSPENPTALLGGLWEVRQTFGKEFADQMVRYTLRATRDNPPKRNTGYGAYIMENLKVGEGVVDNGGRWPRVEEAMRKNNYPPVFKAPQQH
jgi:hypothetical protein